MNTLEQDNYLNLIYKCKDGKQAVLDFYAFKDSILPNKIYRYQKCSNKNIDALKNNYIWLSNPDEFNDLHDCKVNINSDLWVINNVFKHYDLSESETKLIFDLIHKVMTGLDFDIFTSTLTSEKYCRINEILNPLKDITTYKEYYEKFKEYSNPHKEKPMKINCWATCFSNKMDNILMWSHYANWNKGFCVEYDISNDLEFIHYLYPIIYLSAPIFKPELVEMEITISQTIFATSKCNTWAYEEEYRFFGKKSGKYTMKNRPSCLYLGKCINKKDEQKLIKIAEIQGITTVKKMSTIPGRYELSSEVVYSETSQD